ncbi:hypothetical protein [Kitasatospora sp. NBC_01300]|uniref:hypothetical protein n=1 Tax=Kitasatospora sp. NBC_01300 TaxID=2903574 RepID=UPI00352F5B53|nr:hypothetical protein OG556_08560 [Kitasatospora sp. NBC_01300]
MLYWMELRRSPLRWWFPLLIAADLGTLFGRSRWWIGQWVQTSVQVQIPAFYFAPLLAAAAAWAAGRTVRHHLDAQLAISARPRWQVDLTQLSATLTYGLVAYGVGAVVAVVASYPKAGAGFLWPSYLLLGSALLISFASVGHLVGLWVKSQFTGPLIAGLGTMVLIAWAGPPSALGLYVINGAPFQKVAVPALLARCLVAVLLVAAAGLVRRHSLLSTSRIWAGAASRVMAVSICALLCAALVGLVATSPVQVPRAAPNRPVCTDGAPTLCLWPEDKVYLPKAQTMAEHMRQLPSGMFTVPTAFYERGLRGDAAHMYEDFYILEGSMWDSSETMAGGIMSASRPTSPGCGFPPSSRMTPEFIHSSGELNMWLAMRIFGGGQPAGMHGGPPGVDLDAIAHVLTEPEGTQAQWAQQRVEAVHYAYCG